MSKVKSWCRANALLVISLLAAVVTAFFVPPDRDYLGYYDLKTLACLFCVLAVVGALRDLHIFSALSQRMVHTFSTVRGVCTALVVITMFGSMLLTNDTALLTFLPLGWFVLSSTGQEKHTALLFILQNCAANLCGMITPFGNPQNLYLFSYYGLSTKTFFSAMLPPFILSTVLILLCCLVFPKEQLSVPEAQVTVLSRFTQDACGLLVGVNVGGAGTLVASLASLITFREYTHHVPNGGKQFLFLFSGISFAFLTILLAAMSFLNG